MFPLPCGFEYGISISVSIKRQQLSQWSICMNFRRNIILFLSILCLYSCTTYRYEYIAPNDESGKNCAVQCINAKNVCYSGAQYQAQANANICQQQNSYSYQACVYRARSQDEMRRCNPNPQYCSTNPNYWNCEESYRQCFVACGGIVNIYKNQ